jgi:serine phosphatase RsbU (regulator of sigma subunit)/tetratricopeptide (TPR) repeat protein
MKVATGIYFYFFYLILSSIIHPAIFNSENNLKKNLHKIKTVTENDSNLVKSYISLAREISHNDINSSIYLTKKALLISRKIKNKQSIINCLHTLGNFYYIKNLYDSALYYFNEAIDNIKKIPDERQLISAYNDIIPVYNILGQYEESIKYGFLALEGSEKINDSSGIARSLTNLGKAYHHNGEYNSALRYYSKSLNLRENIGDKQIISSILNNIGLIYFEKGINKDKNYFDSSLSYHRMALNYRRKINAEKDIAESYINIGNIFSEINDHRKALYYYRLGKIIFDKLGNEAGLSALLFDIANMYVKNNDLEPAISNYRKGIEITEKIKNPKLLKVYYFSIAEAYASKEDFKNAYKYSNKYNILSDSIYKLESNKQITEITINYESQKKENILLKHNTEIKLSELRRNRIILFISVIIIIAISVLVLILVRSMKNLKKTTQLLVDQNFLITQKSDIITDNLNYAKIIQTALLPSHSDFKTLFQNSFILFMPKDIIGGDFIWYKNINDTKIFALIDCTGHGVSAALMSVIGNTLLNKTIVEEGRTDPAEILYKLDASLKPLLNKGTGNSCVMDGMDIALCSIKNDILTFSGSFMPICIISKGNETVYKGTRYLIGGSIFENKCGFTNETIKLEKGDHIYLFSDGYYDQFGGETFRPLKFKNFQNMLVANHHLSMDKQEQYFQKYIIDWIGDYEQLDDITLVGIRYQ